MYANGQKSEITVMFVVPVAQECIDTNVAESMPTSRHLHRISEETVAD